MNQNFDDLMQSTDTNLSHAKKVAQRWMAYSMPYLNADVNGVLTNKPFNDAMKAIYSSPFQCGDADLASWESNGPTFMPSAQGSQRGGWIDAVYNNSLDTNTYLIGTRTSGFMRSTDGGTSWSSVTDGLDFPILGSKQFLVDPNDPERIIAITGTDVIEGSLIYSTDAGEHWTENQQSLPQFYSMCYHPTIANLIFATSRNDVFISYDNGMNFSSLGLDLTNFQYPFDYPNLHWNFYQIMVLDDKLYAIIDHHYKGHWTMIRCDFTTVDMQNETISTSWIFYAEDDFIDSGKTLIGAQFSNIALNRFYLLVKQATYDAEDNEFFNYHNYIYKSSDLGDNYTSLANISGSGNEFSNVDGDVNNGKCELIASTVDADILYNAVTYRITRWNDDTGFKKVISGASGELTGYHADYRSSQILNVAGKDRMIFGNDGGVGIVRNGLITSPEIYTLNGNLSINLLHAFDVHEESGRVLFAFQDHSMVYRDLGNNYSSRFLHEGSFAMVQQHYPNAIVGQNGYNPGYITDKSDIPHGIVNGTLGPAYLGAYQCHYRYFPDRFLAGLGDGKVALNRAANVSETVTIPFFNGAVGAVAVCQREPQYIYAAANGGGGVGTELLAKSTNDALDANPANNWTSISSNLVQFGDGSTWPLNHQAAYKGIRTIAVDHFDENLVYCGIDKTYVQNNQPMDEKFRVIKSTTGGLPNPNNINNAAWIDYSEGLPALPVERLLTVESDNELIFCATSVGIYYRTASMSQWECFSQGLPFVQITGLQYDYCNNVLYASTYGRGLWKTDVNISIINTYSEIIDETQTWDENKTIYTDITVQTGNTLTIKAIIRMATGTDIIVEPGAQLVVDGGTLTNACGDLWQGIQVWGNYNLPQTSANQGRLIVKNDAVIENAENAVTLWKPNDWAKTGGFVEAYNSTFRNNRRSIEFRSYENLQSNGYIAPNRSIFKNCTFETNNDLLLGETQGNQTMFTMYKVDGVRILGCDFIYNRTVLAYTDLNNAINTIDANFRVNNTCNIILPYGEPCPEPNTRHSTFTGFNKAIHTMGAEWNVGPEIKDAVFSGNMQGINFDAVTAPAAIFNDFTVGNNAFSGGGIPDLHLGIKINDCDEYIVEENKIIGNDSLGWTTHGIYAFDDVYSGNSNSLYKNEYSDLSSASIVQGIHAELNEQGDHIGFRFLCNKNHNNINDFEVRSFNNGQFSKISSYQNGGAGFPASNTFSVGTAGDNIYTHLDFYSNINYAYTKHTGDIDPKEVETYITPPGNIAIASVNTRNTCPTNYPADGGVMFELLTYGKFISEREIYNNLYYTYLQLLDEGNTEGMITEIDLSWPNDAWDLHDELMARSPYNSETVLIAAADKNILTHGMLLEILLANPDALRSGEVINHVQYKIANPLPQYMIDILLNAARDPGTVRSIMEKNLSDLHLTMVNTHKHITHNQLNDTVVGFHPDTLVKYFSSIRSLAGRYQQIYAYTGLNQYANAIAVTDSIANHYRLKNEQYAELNNTKYFIYFLEAVYIDGRNVAQLNSVEIAELTQISDQIPGGQAAERAENILCFFYGLCKEELGAPKNNGIKTKKPKPTEEELYAGLNTVKVAPNPADEYIEFEYDLLLSSEKSELRILDVQGRSVKSWHLGNNQQGIKVLDTRKLPNGVYFYELLQKSEKVKSGKFIIQH